MHDFSRRISEPIYFCGSISVIAFLLYATVRNKWAVLISRILAGAGASTNKAFLSRSGNVFADVNASRFGDSWKCICCYGVDTRKPYQAHDWNHSLCHSWVSLWHRYLHWCVLCLWVFSLNCDEQWQQSFVAMQTFIWAMSWSINMRLLDGFVRT